ncbi:hypothetical protein AB6805_01350 [Chitinophaga sp. RCC_12]|uniref:hypothetical protein n=1 Tax=Chitinophaga sp. RCC_12 TaxID=3239226 RepID=UPI0035263426
MADETSTIFDKDFSDESGVRRRDIAPLALKIYAWAYLVLSLFSVLSSYFVSRRFRDAYQWDEFSTTVLFSIGSTILFPIMRFVPNLLILLEKKYAVLLALIATSVSMLAWCYSAYIIVAYGGMNLIVMVTNISWLAIEIPYLVILLKIRTDWEKGRGRP